MYTKDIFLYHLDNELQKLFSLDRYDYNYIYSILKSITRVAFLICEKRLLIPASNYFESDLSYRILNELKELNEIGAIMLISSSRNIDELITKKINQHGANISSLHYHYRDFCGDNPQIILPGTLKKRERSASSDIKSGWYSLISNSENRIAFASFLPDTVSASKLEDMLYEVPQKLGKRAYISDYVLPLLPIDSEKIKSADYFLNTIITREYISSFLKEFNATCLKDIPILDSHAILPYGTNDEEQYISYNELASELKVLKYRGLSALAFINNCSAYELIEFKNSVEWKSILEKLINPKSAGNIIHEEKIWIIMAI